MTGKPLPPNPSPLPPHQGHRARLRERFMRGGCDGMMEYERLELLLTYVIPLKDVKPLAKDLLVHFQTLGGVLDAEPEELRKIKGMGEVSISGIKLVRELFNDYAREQCEHRDLLLEPSRMVAYARMKIAACHRESTMVILLDARNRLIRPVFYHTGSVDHAPLSCRNIAEDALKFGAVKAVLVHNHPSHDSTPSPEDRAFTIQLFNALQLVEVILVDHLIVIPGEYFSFSESGLLPFGKGDQQK